LHSSFFHLQSTPPPTSTLFPYTTLFRSETKQRVSVPGPLTENIFATGKKVIERITLLRPDLFTHEEHGRTSREHGQTEAHARTCLGRDPRGINERRVIDRYYYCPCRAFGVAGLVVGLVENDPSVLAGVESTREPVHLERLIATEPSSFQQMRAISCHLRIADQ